MTYPMNKIEKNVVTLISFYNANKGGYTPALIAKAREVFADADADEALEIANACMRSITSRILTKAITRETASDVLNSIAEAVFTGDDTTETAKEEETAYDAYKDGRITYDEYVEMCNNDGVQPKEEVRTYAHWHNDYNRID